MTIKHTEGEWGISNESNSLNSPYIKNGALSIVASDDNGRWFICEVMGDVNGGDELEVEANARLIAAAPDLLEALIKVKGVMPFHDGEYTEGEMLAMHKLEKAIKKAISE